MRYLSLLFFSLVFSLALLIDPVAVAGGPAITDLGVLPGGSYSIGYGINQKGEVTGVSATTTGTIHAFLFSGGTMQEHLGTLGGKRSFGLGVIRPGR